MNEELFNEAAKSNVLSKKLIDQLGSGMELYLTGTSRCEELWPYVDEVTEMTTPYRRTPDSHFCEED